jgi:hypothetical protein
MVNYNLKSPVLYIVFNRPDVTMESFKVLSRVKPTKLYLAADGPREGVNGEVYLCNAVREIVRNVNWPCEVHTLFQNTNLGCKKGVLAAINWFFESEEEGIILEDDVIPTEAFFPFCDTLLEKYRNSEQVKAINGFNQFGQEVANNSYFFSRGYYPWGWATWKSRWVGYKEKDIDVSLLDDKAIREVYHKAAIEGVKFNLSIINKGILDTWDYQMLYMIMVQRGYVVAPHANLTSNIGVNGAHSMNNQNIFFKYGEMAIECLEHPLKIEDNKEMNEKLWGEYKEAFFSVKFKSILLKLHIYLLLRAFYKRVMKFYISKIA